MKMQAILDGHYECLQALESVLEKEQGKLLAGSIDVSGLEALANEKQGVLERLDRYETDRLMIQEHAGLGSDGPGAMQAAQRADCEDQWRSILSLAESTALENGRNGQILAIRLEGNERMLSYIRSTIEKREYTAKGTHRAQSGRLNISA